MSDFGIEIWWQIQTSKPCPVSRRFAFKFYAKNVLQFQILAPISRPENDHDFDASNGCGLAVKGPQSYHGTSAICIRLASSGFATTRIVLLLWARMQCIINHASQGAVNLMRQCERRLRAERPIGSQLRY